MDSCQPIEDAREYPKETLQSSHSFTQGNGIGNYSENQLLPLTGQSKICPKTSENKIEIEARTLKGEILIP